MSRLGFKSLVYHGESCLGELDAIPTKDRNFQFPNNEIRIHHISSNSERCHPLSVLQTVSPFSVRCKLESSSNGEQQQLINLHASCFYELKTAVVLTGDEEIHLVAMPSKQKRFPCFWCFSVPCGLYTACSRMLNMRCLSIVFDLDETLIVANTMKSFEDRIEALRNWIARENDLIRISGMSAEMKRCVDDRALLKQYTESDFVHDGGEMYKVQPEEVPLVSGGQDKVVRPVIRLPEKNIVLTRINPENRDTSVLVRLRPAWEDLRSYLTAKGRKRFEVYVCTMAERDYALEMWRLLDPEAHLISSKQLLERIVCVKSGARKSLLNVFQNGNCHPRMAMIIDDRLKVWEDKDQPRVHVVPAFTPYYAPQAETANAVPILCVARNVACNVRGCFFKEFDENLLRRISERFYEDEVVSLPYAPDVSNYMMSEDASFVPNGNGNAPFAEGISGPEVAQRLSQSGEKNLLEPVGLQTTNGPELRSEKTQLPMPTVPQVFASASSKTLLPAEKPSLLGVPFRRDSIFSELEPDAKKRSFLMNHGQDVRFRGVAGPPLLYRLPGQLPGQSLQSQGGLLVEEDNKGQFNNSYSGIVQHLHALRHDKRGRQNLLGQSATTSSPIGESSYVAQVKSEEASPGNEMQKQTYPSVGQLSEVGRLSNHSSLNGKEIPTEGGKVNLPSLSIGVLQEIGRRCSSKVEFRSVVGTGEDLQFSVEVYFTGEKIGTGMGKTRKDAQQQAAENALRNLADEYVSYTIPRSGAGNSDSIKRSPADENGFVWDVTDPGPEDMVVEAVKDNTSEVGIHDSVIYDCFGLFFLRT